MTAKELGLTPGQWRRLTRIDKKILFYYRAMEAYFADIERMKMKGKP